MSDPSPEQRFVERLDRFVTKDDRAALAALRTLVMPADRWTAATWSTVGPLVPAFVSGNDEHRWYLTAGLHAQWHRARSSPARGGSDVGTAARSLAQLLSSDGGLAPSGDRRFSIVLTATAERLDHHLRQLVDQFASHDIPVDFARLCTDLRWWDHPDRFTQRRWARNFWAATASVPVDNESAMEAPL